MKLNKLNNNLLLVCIFCLVAFSSVAKPVKDKKRPNILFILADDQRYGTIGVEEIDQVSTPNLDKLADSGVRLSNCYILGANHGAVCSPSRAMLMTGRHYWDLPYSMHTMWAPEVKKEDMGQCPYITFPEVLKENGYYTFTSGKHHNGHQIVERGFNEAKAAFMGGMSNHFGLKVKDYDAVKGWSDVYSDPSFSSELFGRQVIDFIEDYKKQQPFFVYLSLTSPHDPRTAPDEFHDKYRAEEMVLPDNFMAGHPFSIGDMQIRDERLAGFPRTEEEVKKHQSDYYAMLEANDFSIGKIVSKLKDKGLYENTIIIFSSDNGLAVGQHGLMGKQNVYEHSTKVPMLVSGPGIKKGIVNDQLMYLHDIFPTLCDMLHIDTPQSVATESQKHLFTKKKAKGRPLMYNAYSTDRFERVDGKKAVRGHQRALRKGDFKLILSMYDTNLTKQLFNLEKDPLEQNNLAHRAEYSNKVQELEKLLYKQAHKMNDIADFTKTNWGLLWGGDK